MGFSKQYGGLGFRDLKSFNNALLAKQWWRILHNPYSLSAKILKAKYFHYGSILDAPLRRRPSYICLAQHLVHAGPTQGGASVACRQWCSNSYLARQVAPLFCSSSWSLSPRWVYWRGTGGGAHRLGHEAVEAGFDLWTIWRGDCCRYLSNPHWISP
jgi:hypothetical protein